MTFTHPLSLYPALEMVTAKDSRWYFSSDPLTNIFVWISHRNTKINIPEIGILFLSPNPLPMLTNTTNFHCVFKQDGWKLFLIPLFPSQLLKYCWVYIQRGFKICLPFFIWLPHWFRSPSSLSWMMMTASWWVTSPLCLPSMIPSPKNS